MYRRQRGKGSFILCDHQLSLLYEFIHMSFLCCDIMRFTVLHNRHHKVAQNVPFFMHCKTVTILLRIRVRGHFVMSITNNHESHYVTVLDNPQEFCCVAGSKNDGLDSWSSSPSPNLEYHQKEEPASKLLPTSTPARG